MAVQHPADALDLDQVDAHCHRPPPEQIVLAGRGTRAWQGRKERA
jgi:hypothetical protein